MLPIIIMPLTSPVNENAVGAISKKSPSRRDIRPGASEPQGVFFRLANNTGSAMAPYWIADFTSYQDDIKLSASTSGESLDSDDAFYDTLAQGKRAGQA